MKDYPNIIFIVFDTLRKDVLPIYGGTAITPNLNALTKDAVVFSNAIAPSPWTVPSHASFFTGLYPGEHGAHEYFNVIKNDYEVKRNFDNHTIAEKLKDEGYNTIGVSANGWISPGTGFDNGFDYFEYIPFDYFSSSEVNYGKKFFKDSKLNIKDVLENYKDIPQLYKLYRKNRYLKKFYHYPSLKGANLIIDRLNNVSFNKPFFMFFNFVEPHEPYIKWELDTFQFLSSLDTVKIQIHDLSGYKAIPDRIMEKIKKVYIQNLSKLDFYFGELIKYLKKINEYENTMIIVTSDHGQALKEKNYYGHGIFLYNEIIEVPLIVKFPSSKKIKVMEGYQSLTDLPELIKNVSDGNIIDITKETVFSESFGINVPLHDKLKDKNKVEKMKKEYGNPRKAIYKNDYKLVVGGLDGKIEEFTFKGKNIATTENKKVLDDLLDELEIFKGQENFVVRKKY